MNDEDMDFGSLDIDDDLPRGVKIALMNAWIGYHFASNGKGWSDIKTGLKEIYLGESNIDFEAGEDV